MQVVKLVDPGRVDRIIAFDSLPESMVSNVRRMSADGFPRAWLDFLGVKKADKVAQPFYILDFRTMNRDKEKWQEITNYVRRSTDKNTRLMDNLYDMAKPLSIDSHSSLELEPEDVPIIPILTEVEEIEEKVIQAVEKVEEVKKRGRPKKVVAA
jgi:hypothetical protein